MDISRTVRHQKKTILSLAMLKKQDSVREIFAKVLEKLSLAQTSPVQQSRRKVLVTDTIDDEEDEEDSFFEVQKIILKRSSLDDLISGDDRTKPNPPLRLSSSTVSHRRSSRTRPLLGTTSLRNAKVSERPTLEQNIPINLPFDNTGNGPPLSPSLPQEAVNASRSGSISDPKDMEATDDRKDSLGSLSKLRPSLPSSSSSRLSCKDKIQISHRRDTAPRLSPGMTAVRPLVSERPLLEHVSPNELKLLLSIPHEAINHSSFGSTYDPEEMESDLISPESRSNRTDRRDSLASVSERYERRCVFRIRNFLQSCMNVVAAKFSVCNLIRYLSKVKAIQRVWRDWLECKQARILCLSKMWSKYEYQYVSNIVKNRLKFSREDTEALANNPVTALSNRKLSEASIAQDSFIPKSFKHHVASKLRRWSNIDVKFNELNKKKYVRMGKKEMDAIIVTHMLSREDRQVYLLKLYEESRAMAKSRHLGLIAATKVHKEDIAYSVEDASCLLTLSNEAIAQRTLDSKIALMVTTKEIHSRKKLVLPFIFYKLLLDEDKVCEYVHEAHERSVAALKHLDVQAKKYYFST